jgi:hypothetical protein
VSNPRQRFFFQPLACIRQIGIQRQADGTVTYTFAAQVSKELAPVMITLRVTGGGEVQAQAWFDETIRASLVEYASAKGARMNTTLHGEDEPNMRARKEVQA